MVFLLIERAYVIFVDLSIAYLNVFLFIFPIRQNYLVFFMTEE